jgi:hypothetical protein
MCFGGPSPPPYTPPDLPEVPKAPIEPGLRRRTDRRKRAAAVGYDSKQRDTVLAPTPVDERRSTLLG